MAEEDGVIELLFTLFWVCAIMALGCLAIIGACGAANRGG